MGRQLPVAQMIEITAQIRELIPKAIRDRGLDPAVYDFIKHNWGEGAALVAMLNAEPQPPKPIPEHCASC
jgi:hypothetical protein